MSLFHLEDIYPGWDGLNEGIDYFRRHVAEPLSAGRAAQWQAWDWGLGRYADARRTEPADIVILEGVGSSSAAVRRLLNVSVWVSAPPELRKEQALARDGDTYAPHWERWAAQEQAWAAEDPASSCADITVDLRTDPNNGAGDPAGTACYVLQALAELPLPLTPGWPGGGTDTEAVRVQRLDTWVDPELLYAALYGRSSRAVWLDSSSAPNSGVAGQEAPAEPGRSGAAHVSARSRFSIMADDGGPLGRYAEHRSGSGGGLTTIVSGPVTVCRPGAFFPWLDSVWGRPRGQAPTGYPCGFALGWLGFLGYELKRETGGSDHPAALRTNPEAVPDAALIYAGRAVVLDHEQRCVYVLALAGNSPDGGENSAGSWTALVRQALQTAEAGPLAAVPNLLHDVPSSLPAPQFAARDNRDSYLAKVRSAQEEISNGNSYEVCLTTSLTGHLPEPPGPEDVLALYRRLRRRSPAPFASLLRFGGYSLAGTSPERFLSFDAAGRMRAEPIKGTRPRGATAAEDRELEADLASSVKDRAENIMIVDLLRNDLSRFAVPGSVTVPRLCAVETYATVHQLVSTVDAVLLPGASRAEALAVSFPPGSMTGAPKISTMAILDRLEGAPRGAYSGVVGWFSLTGAADLSVVIRTLEIRNGSLSLGVGGAVTADSDPESEWEEVQAKAFGVLSALGARFPE